MVVRMRHTRSHTANRRSHHALEATSFAKCANCASLNPNHTVCKNCGFYKGRKVVDVVAKVEKRQKKAKAKAAAAK